MMPTLIRVSHWGVLSLIFGGKFAARHCLKSFQLLDRYIKLYGNPLSRYLSIIGAKPEKLPLKGSSDSILMRKIEGALKEHQLDEAWKLTRIQASVWFPWPGYLSNLIIVLSFQLTLNVPVELLI